MRKDLDSSFYMPEETKKSKSKDFRGDSVFEI